MELKFATAKDIEYHKDKNMYKPGLFIKSEPEDYRNSTI